MAPGFGVPRWEVWVERVSLGSTEELGEKCTEGIRQEKVAKGPH